MGAKLYITGIPFYLTERKLRSLLDDFHPHSFTLIQTVQGDVGVVELDSSEDAQKLTATLSRSTLFTLEGGCKLSVVQADSPEGRRLEQLANHIADQTK